MSDMFNMNRYFLYEGTIIRAANHRLYEVLKYWEQGMKVFHGTPQKHEWDITRAAQKLTTKYWEYKKACDDEEHNHALHNSMTQ